MSFCIYVCHTMQYLRFWQQCCRKFESNGRWCFLCNWSPSKHTGKLTRWHTSQTTPNCSVTELHISVLRRAYLYKQRLQIWAHRRFCLVTKWIHVEINDTFKDRQTMGISTGRKRWETNFYENKNIWLTEERMTRTSKEAYLYGQTRYKYFLSFPLRAFSQSITSFIPTKCR
jgi:hypothetical protein